MSYDKNKVIALAESEIGYREKASNANLDDKEANAGHNNWTKYARDLDALGNFYNFPKNGFEWCDMFYDWLIVTSFGAEAAKKLLCQPDYSAGAGCYYSAQYYKQYGQFHSAGSTPLPGDQIFFTYSAGEVSHTGLVVSVDGGIVTTIEGNTSDGVFKRSYSVNDKVIYGYGRPDWGIGSGIEEHKTETYVVYTVQPGDTLFGIAMEHGSTVEAIAAENKIVNPALIYVGQMLLIPDGSLPERVEEELASFPSTHDKEASAPTYSISLTELSEGMNGTTVERVQTLLISRGYKCGGEIDGKTGVEIPDGDFGHTTKKAVEEFQTANGLVADGIVGANTMKALLK